MKTDLILVRHGEVEGRYHRVFGGRIDMELSARGVEQALRLSHWLARFEFSAVYSSPMRRAQLTLEPLRRLLRVDPVSLAGLREVDFGDWTGLGWDDVEGRFGMSAFDWLHHLEEDRVAGAEPMSKFRERVADALDTIRREQAGRTVAVVCHGGVIRMLLALLLDQPLRWFERLEIDYASATWVADGAFRAGRRRTEVQLLNFTPWRDLP